MTLSLYIDIVTGSLRSGPSNAGVTTLPKMVQGDVWALQVYLVQGNSTFPLGPQPFNSVTTAGISLKVAIGGRDGTPDAPLITQQFTWSTDANNQYFYGQLSLNTPTLNAEMLGATQTSGLWIEFKISDANGNITTIFQQPVTIFSEVLQNNSPPAPPAPLAPISGQEVAAEYVKILGDAGKGFYLTTSSGKKLYISAVDMPDGGVQLQSSPVT